MQSSSAVRSPVGLETHGIQNYNAVYWNLSTPLLYEEAIRRREARMAHLGALVVRTGQHTGRSPNDKFIVEEPGSADRVWWGKVNHLMSQAHYERLYQRMMAYLLRQRPVRTGLLCRRRSSLPTASSHCH
ncbi:MAG: phosphoenolpyruvate carboxykinase (ATP) [Aggregatilineales bacterium]